MGNQAGMKRDFEALERRRMKAAELLRKGVKKAEVSRQLGVHRQSVNRWSAALEEEGKEGLKKAGRAGRRPKLNEKDLDRLRKELQRGPEALGYETSLWTSGRVAVLIKELFGIRYHEDHVWRILRKLGWSCQRPVGRALERNEDAIRRWKQRRWPALKKKPTSRGRPSSSSTKAG
jgi:transposase